MQDFINYERFYRIQKSKGQLCNSVELQGLKHPEPNSPSHLASPQAHGPSPPLHLLLQPPTNSGQARRVLSLSLLHLSPSVSLSHQQIRLFIWLWFSFPSFFIHFRHRLPLKPKNSNLIFPLLAPKPVCSVAKSIIDEVREAVELVPRLSQDRPPRTRPSSRP